LLYIFKYDIIELQPKKQPKIEYRDGIMISRDEVKEPKRRILTACVKMFIERGFKQTTMLDIIKEADVSAGTFQNVFRTKDGVLFALVEFMFDNQFAIAREASKGKDGVLIYATETAIQLALTECNENLREIYLEAYTNPMICEYICQKTAQENAKFFAPYNPDWSASDFFEAELGSAGMMRSFMARKADVYFTLQKKTERFLRMAFDVYHVDAADAESALKTVKSMDINDTANRVMSQLFAMLEMTFDFKFSRG